MRDREFRFEPGRLHELGDRPLNVSGILQDQAEVVVRPRVIGLELKCRALLGECARKVAGRPQGDAQVGVRRSELGVEPDRLAM